MTLTVWLICWAIAYVALGLMAERNFFFLVLFLLGLMLVP